MLECRVQQVNGLFAPESPWRKERTDFQRPGQALRRLQAVNAVTVRTNPGGGQALVFAIPGTEEGKRDAALVRRLLGLDTTTDRCPIVGKSASQSLALQGRSMLATLYYLSQGLDGPPHGWSEPDDDALLRVRASRRAPRDAYAAVPYGGQTFDIDAGDTESQGIFVLP